MVVIAVLIVAVVVVVIAVPKTNEGGLLKGSILLSKERRNSRTIAPQLHGMSYQFLNPCCASSGCKSCWQKI